MQIVSNTTGMPAALTVATDKDGRDWCVVVVKGTFAVGRSGAVAPAEEQEPMVYADEHYGDPGETSIKYECDFARFKPRADVIVNGHAYSPTGEPVTELEVALEVEGEKDSINKRIRVVGDRHWENSVFRLRPSAPEPFVTMPLIYERAFGGSDHTHEKPKYQGTELRNPVGVGYRKNFSDKAIVDTLLPNLEDPQHLIGKWSDTPPPGCLGIVGRGWQPRIKYAGTYDQKWMDERLPFLPADFDDQFFLSAPTDQQVPFLKGGERVRCENMTPAGTFSFAVPEMEVPVTYHFRDREEPVDAKLDTLLIEPDQGRFFLTFRAAAPVGRKLNALREVSVGQQPRPSSPSAGGKRRFASLAEMVAWERKRRNH